MMGGVIEQLANFGALGVMCGFLVWLYIGTQRRADANHRRLTETMERLSTDYDARIEGMRARYGTVIDGLRSENKIQHEEYQRRLDRIDAALRELER